MCKSLSQRPRSGAIAPRYRWPAADAADATDDAPPGPDTGLYTAIVKTTDAGATWSVVYTNEGNFILSGIDCADALHCIAVGSGGSSDRVRAPVTAHAPPGAGGSARNRGPTRAEEQSAQQSRVSGGNPPAGYAAGIASAGGTASKGNGVLNFIAKRMNTNKI